MQKEEEDESGCDPSSSDYGTQSIFQIKTVTFGRFIQFFPSHRFGLVKLLHVAVKEMMRIR